MNYWQALPGNMAETTEAYFRYFEDRIDDFRQNAQHIFGCRGIHVPSFSADAGGLCRAIPPHCLYWTGAGGWLSALFFDHYLYTNDQDFLKHRALPFLEEVAQFYLDFFVEDENGVLKSYPSNSPENCPQQHQEVMVDGQITKKRISVAINATMDFAIAKEVFSNVLTAHQILAISGDFNHEITTALSQLPKYEINEDGAIKEWLHPDFPDNDEHRHESHIYPCFPGFEVTKESDASIFEACKVAIDRRKTIGLKDQTGWSLTHMANACARMEDGQTAHRALEIMAQTCVGQNFFTYHNDDRKMGPTVDMHWGDRPPFQIDANLGFPAAILEMLCFSKPGMIKLLPALPSQWGSGSLTGVSCRGGVSLDLNWSPDEVIVKLQSQCDQSLSLITPLGQQDIELQAGKLHTQVMR